MAENSKAGVPYTAEENLLLLKLLTDWYVAKLKGAGVDKYAFQDGFCVEVAPLFQRTPQSVYNRVRSLRKLASNKHRTFLGKGVEFRPDDKHIVLCLFEDIKKDK